MTDRIKCRKALKKIATTEKLKELLDKFPFSAVDRQIMEMYYINKYQFNFIADTLGYSEVTVRLKHAHILDRIISSDLLSL